MPKLDWESIYFWSKLGEIDEEYAWKKWISFLICDKQYRWRSQDCKIEEVPQHRLSTFITTTTNENMYYCLIDNRNNGKTHEIRNLIWLFFQCFRFFFCKKGQYIFIGDYIVNCSLTCNDSASRTMPNSFIILWCYFHFDESLSFFTSIYSQFFVDVAVRIFYIQIERHFT